MKKILILLLATLFFNSYLVHAKKQILKKAQTKNLAEWTIVVYMQADNNLAPFAIYNVEEMQKGMLSADQVNLLIEWDQPQNQKTWRYRILPGDKVDVGSLETEMGTDPVTEIVDAMLWAQTEYPAKKYALILWNHGSGVEDFKDPLLKTKRMFHSWITLPGCPCATKDGRGILYDDSQGTVLTNQGLASALTQIKTNLGKNIDLLGMDACLMAMLEIGYQVKECVDYFVGSQQTEPGLGWAYAKWLAPLTANPSNFAGPELSQAIVTSYEQFYKYETDAQDYTQSAVQVSALDDIVVTINQFVADVAACKAINAEQTKKLIKAARRQSCEFYMQEYIDLYSFYAALNNKLAKASPKSARILNNAHAKPAKKPHNQEFLSALAKLKKTVLHGMRQISAAVIANVKGLDFVNVQGISIYYPTTGVIHESYPLTQFAQDTTWISFLNEYSK